MLTGEVSSCLEVKDKVCWVLPCTKLCHVARFQGIVPRLIRWKRDKTPLKLSPISWHIPRSLPYPTVKSFLTSSSLEMVSILAKKIPGALGT